MRWILFSISLVVLAVLVAAGCSRGSQPAAEATSTPVLPTATPTPPPLPTPTPIPGAEFGMLGQGEAEGGLPDIAAQLEERRREEGAEGEGGKVAPGPGASIRLEVDEVGPTWATVKVDLTGVNAEALEGIGRGPGGEFTFSVQLKDGKVRVTGLAPETRYLLQLRAGEVASPQVLATTMAAPAGGLPDWAKIVIALVFTAVPLGIYFFYYVPRREGMPSPFDADFGPGAAGY